MNRSSREWLVALTGVLFIILVVVSFVVVGDEPPDAEEPAAEIAEYYVEDKDSIQVGAVIGGVAAVALIFFAGYLRKVLRAAEGPDGMLSLVSFIGAVIIAIGASIDGTLSFAIAEAADDIEPESVRTLQALWDNDWLPFAVGTLTFLLATGISVVRHGALPKWLGWIAIALAVIALTPLGFAAFIGAALWVLVASILLSVHARREAGGTPAAPTA